jgi:ribosomal protein S18 acetylase RimI-like enzyme
VPLIVRRLKVMDLPVIETLESESSRRHPTRAGWMDHFRHLMEVATSEEPEGVLVAEYDGRVIGAAVVKTLGQHPYTGVKFGELQALTVAPGWRGQGIDARLVREAEAYLKARGCETLTTRLPADASNEESGLLKGAGYKVVGWELERTLK